MIKGKSLMIGIEKADKKIHTIAMATSCTLDVKTDLSDSTTKDDNDSGVSQEVTGKSGELKTENLIPVGSQTEQTTYMEMLKLLHEKKQVNLSFLLVDALGKDTGDAHDWNGVADMDILMTGKALLMSVELNASNKENATMSATFKLCGSPTINAAVTKASTK